MSWKANLAWAAVLLLGVGGAMASIEEAKAPELTAQNFDETLKAKEGIWFLDFYAPWCGHCKRLSPVWDEASAALEEEGLPVHMAKVDCTSHSKICERYNVNGYPSLRVLSHQAEIVRPFKGGRNKEAIIKYARRLAGTKISKLESTKEVKDFMSKDQAVFILYEPAVPQDGWEELKTAFEAVAEKYYDVATLATAPEYTADDLGIKTLLDGKLLSEDEGFGGRLVVYREGEGKCLGSKMKLTPEDVGHFVDGHRYIMLPRVEPSNYRDLGDRNKPLVIAVLRGKSKPPGEEDKPSEDSEAETIPINAEFLASVKGVAREKEDDFAFGYLDGKQWHQFVTKYGITTRVLPRLLIIDVPTEYYLPVPVDVKGHHSIVEFLDKVTTKEVKMSRSLEATFKAWSRDYWHYALGSLFVLVALPIAYTIWTDPGVPDNKKSN